MARIAPIFAVVLTVAACASDGTPETPTLAAANTTRQGLPGDRDQAQATNESTVHSSVAQMPESGVQQNSVDRGQAPSHNESATASQPAPSEDQPQDTQPSDSTSTMEMAPSVSTYPAHALRV